MRKRLGVVGAFCLLGRAVLAALLSSPPTSLPLCTSPSQLPHPPPRALPLPLPLPSPAPAAVVCTDGLREPGDPPIARCPSSLPHSHGVSPHRCLSLSPSLVASPPLGGPHLSRARSLSPPAPLSAPRPLARCLSPPRSPAYVRGRGVRQPELERGAVGERRDGVSERARGGDGQGKGRRGAQRGGG